MLIVSFATPDYAEHAARMMSSCDQFSYRRWVERIHDKGPWEHICAKKPAFIAKALFSSGEPVLWLDADAVIERPLHEFEQLDADFAIFRDKDYKSPKAHFRSGTVWFNNTDAAISLLAHWAERCEEEPDTWDQQHLYDVWTHWQHKGTTYWLPETYCKIFDKDKDGITDPHIIHYQASRQLKDKRCLTKQ
jgi:hypothetical protein